MLASLPVHAPDRWHHRSTPALFLPLIIHWFTPHPRAPPFLIGYSQQVAVGWQRRFITRFKICTKQRVHWCFAHCSCQCAPLRMALNLIRTPDSSQHFIITEICNKERTNIIILFCFWTKTKVPLNLHKENIWQWHSKVTCKKVVVWYYRPISSLGFLNFLCYSSVLVKWYSGLFSTKNVKNNMINCR